jgi:hypothetical protein
MPNYTTGHRQEPPPLALHPCSVTERAVHRLLNDPAERESQLQVQQETVERERLRFEGQA